MKLSSYGLLTAVAQLLRPLLPVLIAGLALLQPLSTFALEIRIDEDAPWPRIRSTNGNTLILHLPQVERWTSNSFTARAAVQIKTKEAKDDLLGVIWFDAHGSVDRSDRMVRLDRFEVTKGRFPEAPDGGSNALALVRQLIPAGARIVSLDYLVTSLGFEQAAARQGTSGLSHNPPEIIWSTNRAVLVRIDGAPVLRPIPDSTLQRVVNTPALLVSDTGSGKFYLSGQGQWFTADAITAPWSLAQIVPPGVTALAPASAKDGNAGMDEPPPRVIVSTSPSELLMTASLPDFKPIRGTALQYAADSDSQLFFHNTEREAYLLVSGRWFKAKSLTGPWNYVAPRDLPADFAKIPPGSPQAVVLASVPDTPQADLALLANSAPTTASVDRRSAKIDLEYDGEPQFKPIEGTAMSYALNAQLPVVQTGTNYFALDDGIWFVASSPKGSWEVATEVPEEIYTIPPSSPVYYATYARVYEATDDNVEVGYTPGYTGAYENDGTVVYGTGYNYQPWYGNEYYGWGWTWGYSYVYVPWYQSWLWRPWWNEGTGLRSAVIENIYGRWQNRNGAVHYAGSPLRAPTAPTAPSAPRAPNAPSSPTVPNAPRAPSAGRAPSAPLAPLAERAPSAGYPALYGRFRGTTQPGTLPPPANTLALNPYSRPQTSVRPGEVPHGAQLLSAVRQAPGGGRDLYASPDGNIYRRNNDGWYRREAGGGWRFYAPTQSRVEGGQLQAARGAQPSAAGVQRPASVGRSPAAAGRAPTRIGQVPDTGVRARAQEVAALERQYYARALGQMRAQNWRGSAGVSRPARRGGGRR